MKVTRELFNRMSCFPSVQRQTTNYFESYEINLSENFNCLEVCKDQQRCEVLGGQNHKAASKAAKGRRTKWRICG